MNNDIQDKNPFKNWDPYKENQSGNDRNVKKDHLEQLEEIYVDSQIVEGPCQ